jgi:hypothetical protein
VGYDRPYGHEIDLFCLLLPLDRTRLVGCIAHTIHQIVYILCALESRKTWPPIIADNASYEGGAIAQTQERCTASWFGTPLDKQIVLYDRPYGHEIDRFLLDFMINYVKNLCFLRVFERFLWPFWPHFDHFWGFFPLYPNHDFLMIFMKIMTFWWFWPPTDPKSTPGRPPPSKGGVDL